MYPTRLVWPVLNPVAPSGTRPSIVAMRSGEVPEVTGGNLTVREVSDQGAQALRQ